jgi:hydroxymethylbilane synthase
VLRIGTRGSALALAQTRNVIDDLGGGELVVIEASGSALNDKARWTRALDMALLNCEIDIAVHSAKDVPAERPAGITQAAVPQREDPRDRLCGAESIEALATGARIGTASPRRVALISALRGDVAAVELRGNVDTRLRRLDDGTVDATVLAAAGLNRLGLTDVGVPLDPATFTPAAGQGALLLECRAKDAETLKNAATVNHSNSATELAFERAVVIALDADCHTPLGALARCDGSIVTLDVVVLASNGNQWIRDRAVGVPGDAQQLVGGLIQNLRAAGADELLAESRGELA